MNLTERIKNEEKISTAGKKYWKMLWLTDFLFHQINQS